ncbi:glycoside hydrolase family 9 protein [Sabulibacter ruber]|uniref:glycoside hydrolase family 9 protein n=1 Tax=Sabulibacter ruber TaxID=2811901 RepID=UPI001A96B7B7|nr:glycoside hydrolase family 9 protein [Sabulibacter ruber]
MIRTLLRKAIWVPAFAVLTCGGPLYFAQAQTQPGLRLNELEYLEMPGLNVMLAHDFYPESHQGGVGIIQNGLRIGTNGDLRLEPTPGQWQPVPKVGPRVVDRATQTISVRMEYPDPDKNRKGFNPIIYPDLNFAYEVKVRPEGKNFRIIVDLDKPLPEEWIGKVGFNFELFPGILFGKTYYMDQQFGIFPRQLNGPGFYDASKEYQTTPLASGQKLTIVPEDPRQTLTIQNVSGEGLQLIDGRAQHNNGWFVVRSLVKKGASKGAIEWLISPNAIAGWKSEPVVQVSQVGYHPKQQKVAVIELDKTETQRHPVTLFRVNETGGLEKVMETQPKEWGKFLRYHYLQFDFTQVQKPGMYKVKYGAYETSPFQISEQVFKRHVWQPVIETFLPVQMCHMRINDRYKVWHDVCHLDDARMAPLNHNHFDGYLQGPSTLTKYQPGEHVPNLAVGGWHDAGDYDMRVESLADEIRILSLAFEEFKVKYDNTSIDQKLKIAELHRPDGKNDLLQQVEHGALSIVAGYQNLGRLYRGIIEPSLRQYTLLGDASTQTDEVVFDAAKAPNPTPPIGQEGAPDDRWVFTEENPGRELQVASCLAVASRALKGYNDTLSTHCLRIAQELWDRTQEKDKLQRVNAAAELFLSTKDKKYANWLVANTQDITKNISRTGWVIGRTLPLIKDKKYKAAVLAAVQNYKKVVEEQERKTPYGMPYEPDIWGAGWGIQNFGVQQFFLHTSYPEIFPRTYMLHAMNFVLGVHPGSNVSSFASGVGAKSLTTAYGNNRDEWSYIPGGVGSGTALIRPDFPELLHWPYLWQQTEYVIGGGSSDYMFLILAADHLLSK